MRASTLARAASALVACGVLVVTVSSCGKTRACKAGTVLVTAGGSAADGADTLSLDISVGGGAPKTVTAPWRAGGGTIEIDFPAGYPRGQTVTVAATALQAGTAIATATATVTLTDACEPLALSFGGSGDGGSDGGSDGMCTPTVTSCPATVTCGKIDDGCGNLTVDCGACQVNAADRELAAAGDTITLEGKFADPTEVTFPGGTKATATLLGPDRATVVVPSDAGEGQMAIVSNHSPAVSLPFRRTTYAVEVQSFRQSYEQVSYARQMPQMSEGRFWTAAVAGDRYVYVLGGTTSVTADSGVSVEEAMINADGTLGAMRLSPNKMTTTHAYAPAVRIGNKVYVLGGNDGNVGGTTAASVTNVVDVATIGVDGRIGPWSAAPATLKATRAIGGSTFNGVWGHSAAVIGNWLYVFGGSLGPYCSGVATTQIERAPINPDGTIGDFAIATAALATAESNGAAVVDGGYVYVISGTKIQFSAIMPNGDLAGFNDAGVTLPSSGAHGGAAVINNALYVFGAGSSVVKLAVNANGTLGAPTTITATMGGYSNFGWAFVGHNLYAFGGGDGNACGAAFIQFGRLIQRASLEGGGAISTFTSVPAVNTAAKRSSFVAAVVGSRVYAIGGQQTASDPDVDVATVGADGKLGTFATQAGVSLVTKRFQLSGAVVGDNLYVLGGSDAGGAYPSAVEVAPIAADGTLGTFAVAKVNGTGANVAITTARAGATVFVAPGDHNGGNPDYLCIAGGANASGVTAVECAVVNADGTLAGNLAPLMPASNLTTARPALPSPYVGDKLYVMAGSSSSSTLDAAPYDATSGQPGAFAASVTLSNQIMYRVGWSIGSAVFIAAGDGGLGAYPPDIQVSPIAANGSLANFTTSTVSLAFGRVGGRAVVLGARVWAFGGVNNLGAADTEFAELR